MLSPSIKNKKVWRSITLLGGCVLAATLSIGCRSNDPSVDLLENELRWMEDQLYEMEDQLEQTCVDLHRCKSDHEREIATYEQRAEIQSQAVPHELVPVANPAINPAMDSSTHSGIEVQSIGTNESPPSQVILPDGTVYADEDFIAEPDRMESYADSLESPNDYSELAAPAETYDLPSTFPEDTSPVIVSQDDPNPVSALPERDELPAPVSPKAEIESDLQPTPAGTSPKLEVPDQPELDRPEPGSRPSLEEDIGGQALRLIPPTPQNPYSVRLQSHVSTERIPSLSSATKKRTVDAHITHIVTQSHRTARSLDGRGHDLEILVQPRNADGNYVSLPANISVVVIDDELTGDAARVARWDLDASETSRLFRDTEQGEGIHLEFDWPHGDPIGEKLHLYVRYVTIDGRKVQSHQFLEPLSKSKGASDDGWSVIGRTKPLGEWRVVSQPLAPAVQPVQAVAPIKSAASSATTRVSPVAPIPVSVGQSRIVPAAAAWEVVPAKTMGVPGVPGRLPNVKTQPIPIPGSPTPQAQFSRIPASVPEWSPRR